MAEPTHIATTITGCARCLGTHPHLEFRALTRAAGEWTHWAACPVTSQPILFRVQRTDCPARTVPVVTK